MEIKVELVNKSILYFVEEDAVACYGAIQHAIANRLIFCEFETSLGNNVTIFMDKICLIRHTPARQ